MEVVACASAAVFPTTAISTPAPTRTTSVLISNSTPSTKYSSSLFLNNNNHQQCIKRNNRGIIPAVVTDVSAAIVTSLDSAVAGGQVEITWQIIVGALAGVTPFVVAGIEFGKRILAQRKCSVCGGSGLVLREKDYFKCPGCGGFLPWQSWKRFFTG